MINLNRQEILTQAQNLHHEGQLAAASALYRQVLEVNPRDADATYGLGTVYLQQENLEEALQLLQRAAATMPEVVTPRMLPMCARP